MTESQPRRVLVVEDDAKIARLLVDYLRADGFETLAIHDGGIALREVKSLAPAAIVLDVMLPGLGGVEVCRAVRLFSDVPIIMLTARVEEADRLLGLNVGADDYLCKPFSPREVVARVRGLVWCAEGRAITEKSWLIDEEGLRIRWEQEWLSLTPLEFRMLRTLLSRPGRVFSRAQLLDSVQADSYEVSDRSIDSHIKNLRKKMHTVAPGNDCIAAVYGIGYRFDAPAGTK